MTNVQQDTAIEELRRELTAVTLLLRNTQLDLMDAKDYLESSQADLDAAFSSLAEKDLELESTKVALANSECARLEANRDRVLSRPQGKQRFLFRKPQPLPVGGYRFFALQRKAVDRTLNQFILDNPDLDAVETEGLRFDRSPRGENVYQQMRGDKTAPIEFSRRNFVLKDGRPEKEMISSRNFSLVHERRFSSPKVKF
ncbi:hypothetical protein BGZ76_004617 [Entomortierella beljakovae]|nr:hypothetical protein BGZ76_004617 [Entomortierella beljakovae]